LSKDIFTKRGITPPWAGGRVAQAQGFARYEGADWGERRAIVAALEELYASDKHPDEGKARQLWSRAVARADRQFGRNAVTRHLDGSDSPATPYLNAASGRLSSQAGQAWVNWLRKALAVDGWLMPRHATMPDSAEFSFRARPVAQLRPDEPVVMGTGWEWHHHGSDLSSREREAHEAKLCELAPPEGHAAAVEHPAGSFLPTGHLHPLTGDLVVSTNGRHRHWKHAKYLYTPGDTARRLGTNPLALERGWGDPDDLFVVVLEGTLKMCSVVEAGYLAVDAGSVTLWGGGVERLDVEDGIENLYVHTELEEFATRHLRSRPVAVVCDSDWHSNPLVLEQTERVAAILNEAGARAVACAPPEGRSRGWRHPVSGAEQKIKRGVDDWLGEHEPGERHDAMLELVCRPRRVGDSELTADHPALEGIRADGRENTVALVRTLGEWASPEGVAPYAETRLSESLGLSKRAVQMSRRRAVERHLLEPLTEAERGRNGADHYMQAPLVRVVPEALPTYRTTTLREWLATLK
jgi:hypothetical protein